jgi:hypothetical protein
VIAGGGENGTFWPCDDGADGHLTARFGGLRLGQRFRHMAAFTTRCHKGFCPVIFK